MSANVIHFYSYVVNAGMSPNYDIRKLFYVFSSTFRTEDSLMHCRRLCFVVIVIHKICAKTEKTFEGLATHLHTKLKKCHSLVEICFFQLTLFTSRRQCLCAVCRVCDKSCGVFQHHTNMWLILQCTDNALRIDKRVFFLCNRSQPNHWGTLKLSRTNLLTFPNLHKIDFVR